MVNELDTVVLLRDIKNQGLKRGDIGAVVHKYSNNKALEVEFVTGEGKTISVLTVTPEDIRRMGKQEILHARTLAV